MSVKCLQIFFLAHPIESNLSHGGGFFWLAPYLTPDESEHWLWPTQRHGGCGVCLNTLEPNKSGGKYFRQRLLSPIQTWATWDWWDIQILWTQDDGLIKPDKTETGPWDTFFGNLVPEYKWVSTRHTLLFRRQFQILCISFWQHV